MAKASTRGLLRFLFLWIHPLPPHSKKGCVLLSSLVTKLKQRAKQCKQELIVLFYAYKHPASGILPKIITLIALGYALSPIDLIPDFIPIIGYLDDLILLPLLITLAIRLMPSHVMVECRRKAEENPLKLKENWVAATIFIILWLSLFILTVGWIMGVWEWLIF